jgi:hypothetical protein
MLLDRHQTEGARPSSVPAGMARHIMVGGQPVAAGVRIDPLKNRAPRGPQRGGGGHVQQSGEQRPKSAMQMIGGRSFPPLRPGSMSLEVGGQICPAYLPGAAYMPGGAHPTGTRILATSSSMPKLGATKKKKGPNLEKSLERMGDALYREQKALAAQQEEAERSKEEVERRIHEAREETKAEVTRQWMAEVERLKGEHADEKAMLIAGREKSEQGLRADHERLINTAKSDAASTLKIHGMLEEKRLEELKEKMEEAAAQQAEKEKEERVELLRRQMMRRMMNAGISSAWSAWYDLWSAKTYALGRLREVGNRLRAPEKAVAFGLWVEAWGQWQHAAEMRKRAEREMELSSGKEALERQFAAIVAEYEQRLAEVEAEKKRALERQRIELTGNAEEMATLREAEEKEARIELLRRQIGRRIKNQGLAFGWSAWVELWEAKTYALKALRDVANRLRKPGIAQAFSNWVHTWHAKRERLASSAASQQGSVIAEQAKRCEALERECGTLRLQIATANEERHELRQQLAMLGGGVEEVEALRAEQAQRDKEERIELLRRQIMRRVLNHGMTQGWTAWVDFWENKTYAMHRIRQIANRLRTPGLARAFEWLVVEWQECKREAELAEMRRRQEAVLKSRAAAEGQLAQVREEYEARLAAAEEEKELALARLTVQLTGNADEVAALREAKEKEARIELVRRQVMRRMMNTSLASGWGAWHELWSAKVYAKQRLRECANRLKSPDLANAYELWVRRWEHAKWQRAMADEKKQHAALEHEKRELDASLVLVRQEYEQKLAYAEEQRIALLEKVAALGGDAAAAEALTEAQAQKDKEERVELLRRQIVRRIKNQGLARGWISWVEMWQARVEGKATLRKVANRLRAPEKAFAFSVWLEVNEEARLASKVSLFHQREAKLHDDIAGLMAEVKRTRAEMEAKLRSAAEQRETALQRQLIELTGSAEDIIALREEKEKEERVEMMRRQSMRRLLNRDLADGFTAWTELWEAKVYSLRRLREVANRLSSPALSSAFGFWVQDTKDIKHEAEMAELKRLSESVEAQLRQSRHDANKLAMVRIANQDEIKALKEKLAELTEKVQQQANSLVAATGLAGEHVDLRSAYIGAQEAAAQAQKDLEEAERDGERQRNEAQELLEKLLSEQRATFEKDTEDMSASLSAWTETKQKLGEDLTRSRLDLERTQKAHAKEIEAMRKEMAGQQAEYERALAGVQKDLDKTKAALEKAKAKPVKKPPPPTKPSPLGNLDLDESPDAPPISEQLGAALKKSAMRVMELFRSWDADGDGEVTRTEFHRAMVALGLEVPKKEIDKLFSEWDKSGDGSIGFKELQKILKAPSSPAQPKTVADAGKNVATSIKAVSKLSAAAKLAAPASAAKALTGKSKEE